MTQMLSRAAVRQAPVPEPLSASLLETIKVVEGRVDGQNLSGVYTSLNCLPIPGVTQLCMVDPDDPTFEPGFSVVDGVSFVATMGFECQTLGLDWTQVNRDFNAVIDLRESAVVEHSLMVLRFTGTEGGPAAVDLTPAGGAVCIEYGVALLEGNAGTQYAGLPTLHVPRTVASMLLGGAPNVVRSGNTIRTALGSKLVAGAGYDLNVGPDGEPPAAGEMWIYASGEVEAIRGPRIQIAPQFDRTTNKTTILAQRPYEIDVDCYLTAVRVKVS